MRLLLPMLLAVTALAAPKRPVTHEDIWLMKRTGEPVVSPDGRSIVFTLTEPDYDAAKQWTDLWLVPADGSAPARRITHTRGAENGVAWSPDGSRLAFSAKSPILSPSRSRFCRPTRFSAWRRGQSSFRSSWRADRSP